MTQAKYVVTGGAGFIGSNVVERLLRQGDQVVLIDNLSRRGTTENLDRLRQIGEVIFEKGNVHDFDFVNRVFKQHRDCRAVFHLAGQVAVTTSVTNPRDDFQSNALGTFNVLEAIRTNSINPVMLYASTNKVYGKMDGVAVVEGPGGYEYRDLPMGVSESYGLSFHSPYGCSKGCADQYVVDYARIYGLRTVCFRQSCIYGYNQFGITDQGWVAWFIIAALARKPIIVYGDGKQVRDILFIDDLVDLYLAAIERIDGVAGNVYNVGGGPEQRLSLRELIKILQRKISHPLEISYQDWRPGDQKVFVADIRSAYRDLNWKPQINVTQGIDLLFDWASANLETCKRIIFGS